jgi:hypothetical protein
VAPDHGHLRRLPVAGNLIGPTQGFEIRFGTEGSQWRAYFTERGPGTSCDIDLINVLDLVSDPDHSSAVRRAGEEAWLLSRSVRSLHLKR